MSGRTVAPQHFGVFRILLVLLASSIAFSAICIQNIEAMTALNKHLVALIKDVSLANCMAEREIKVMSTYILS